MDLKKKYTVDKNAIENGRWMPLGDAKFNLARLGNTNYKREYRRIIEEYEPKLQGVPDDEVEEHPLNIEANCKVLAKTVLLDWKGVTEDGQEVAYSEEKAFEYLQELEDFRTDIIRMANDRDNFRVEKIGGKSQKP